MLALLCPSWVRGFAPATMPGSYYRRLVLSVHALSAPPLKLIVALPKRPVFRPILTRKMGLFTVILGPSICLRLLVPLVFLLLRMGAKSQWCSSFRLLTHDADGRPPFNYRRSQLLLSVKAVKEKQLVFRRDAPQYASKICVVGSFLLFVVLYGVLKYSISVVISVPCS